MDSRRNTVEIPRGSGDCGTSALLPAPHHCHPAFQQRPKSGCTLSQMGALHQLREAFPSLMEWSRASSCIGRRLMARSLCLLLMGKAAVLV